MNSIGVGLAILFGLFFAQPAIAADSGIGKSYSLAIGGTSDDAAIAIASHPAGGYIVSGTSRSALSKGDYPELYYDIVAQNDPVIVHANGLYLFRTDEDGQVLWGNRYPEYKEHHQNVDMALLPDGTALLVGAVREENASNGSSENIPFILLAGPGGKVLTYKKYPQIKQDQDVKYVAQRKPFDIAFEKAIVLRSGSFAVTGRANGTSFVMRLSAKGSIEWFSLYKRLYKEHKSERRLKLVELTDGQILTVGDDASTGTYGFLLTAWEGASGAFAWASRVRDLGHRSHPEEVIALPDGRIAVAGTSIKQAEKESKNVQAFLYIASIAQVRIGAGAWYKYGKEGTNLVRDLVHMPDGGFAMTGTTTSFDKSGGSDMMQIRTDANGKMLVYKGYWGKQLDRGAALVPANLPVNGEQQPGVVMVGATKSYGYGGFDVYMVKTNAIGEALSPEKLVEMGRGAVFRGCEGEKCGCPAYTSKVETNGNVYQGPGKAFPVIGTLAKDDAVRVRELMIVEEYVKSSAQKVRGVRYQIYGGEGAYHVLRDNKWDIWSEGFGTQNQASLYKYEEWFEIDFAGTNAFTDAGITYCHAGIMGAQTQ